MMGQPPTTGLAIGVGQSGRALWVFRHPRRARPRSRPMSHRSAFIDQVQRDAEVVSIVAAPTTRSSDCCQ